MKPIIIFGASVMGEELLKLGIKPACFVDNDVKKQKKFFHGYGVLSFEELRRTYPEATIIIAAHRYYEEILEQVEPYYTDIYRLSHPEVNSFHGWQLPRLNIVVTEKCTLRCKNCSSLMPLYKKPKHCNVGVLIASMLKVFDCFNHIGRVEVLGGEPFLNLELPFILEHLVQLNKTSNIEVVTNGTIVPPQKVLHKLEGMPITIVVNNYGTNRSKLIDALRKANIPYRENTHWSWANLGGFHKRHRYHEELVSLFKRCNFNTCSELLNGYLYRCPRSSHGTNLDLIPLFPSDFVDIYGGSNLGEKVNQLYAKEYLCACDYCDGNTRETLNVKAGS